MAGKGKSSGRDGPPAAAAKPGRKHWDAKLSHKAIHTIVTIVVTLVIFGGGGYGYYIFSQDTKESITNNPGPALTRTVEALNPNTALFDESHFEFKLPGDWKRLQPDLVSPTKKYSYQSGLKNADNRYMYIYTGAIPAEMAVNKAVRVNSEGNTVTHGQVSTNCIEFTAESAPKKFKVPAKWDGIDFLCDMDSKFRNVAGTSAPGSINKVTLTSPTSFTKYDFFFVYEDNNYNPDYSIFYDMLNSFKVK